MTQPEQQAGALYVRLEGATLKMGTCNHCVLEEVGRPERAWEPEGDRELDFDRDAFIAQMLSLGVEVKLVDQYVCP